MSNPMQMWNAWYSLSLKTARLAWEAQSVVALRCMQIAVESAQGRQTEARRMVTEKVAALTEAQVAAATAAIRGRQQPANHKESFRSVQKTRSSQQTKTHEIKRPGKSQFRNDPHESGRAKCLTSFPERAL